MKVIITFDTDNDAFQDYPHGNGNFEEEVSKVLKQAEDFIKGKSHTDILKDSNGNTVGNVFVSSFIRRPNR